MRSAPNVPALDGLHVGDELEARTGRASFAENDANAAALAEAWLGAGRGARHVLYVTLGTGVGGGLVFDGRIWLGRNGYAGEIGHIQVEPDGIPCGCGSWGCLETIAGVPRWTRRAEALLATGRASTLAGRSPLDPQVIVEAARGEDAVALEVVDGAARAVGVGVAAVLDLLNVDRVVVGGGVASAGLLPPRAHRGGDPAAHLPPCLRRRHLPPGRAGIGRRGRGRGEGRDDRRGERVATARVPPARCRSRP